MDLMKGIIPLSISKGLLIGANWSLGFCMILFRFGPFIGVSVQLHIGDLGVNCGNDK